MSKSETTWEDEKSKVKITIEVESKGEIDETSATDILKQAEYCILGLGYDSDVFCEGDETGEKRWK